MPSVYLPGTRIISDLFYGVGTLVDSGFVGRHCILAIKLPGYNGATVYHRAKDCHEPRVEPISYEVPDGEG